MAPGGTPRLRDTGEAAAGGRRRRPSRPRAGSRRRKTGQRRRRAQRRRQRTGRRRRSGRSRAAADPGRGPGSSRRRARVASRRSTSTTAAAVAASAAKRHQDGGAQPPAVASAKSTRSQAANPIASADGQAPCRGPAGEARVQQAAGEPQARQQKRQPDCVASEVGKDREHVGGGHLEELGSRSGGRARRQQLLRRIFLETLPIPVARGSQRIPGLSVAALARGQQRQAPRHVRLELPEHGAAQIREVDASRRSPAGRRAAGSPATCTAKGCSRAAKRTRPAS